MSIEAMKQAVEAFEHIKKYVTDDGAMPENWDAYHEKEYYALEALRQAIEQAEQWDTSDMAHRPGGLSVEQEPVAWMEIKVDAGFKEFTVWKEPISVNSIPLYTAPPKRPVKSYTNGEPQYATDAPKREWVGLTDVEVGKYSDRLNGGDIAREVEAKLKEKNGG